MAATTRHGKRDRAAVPGGRATRKSPAGRERDPELARRAEALDPEMPEPEGAAAAAFQRLRERAASRDQARDDSGAVSGQDPGAEEEVLPGQNNRSAIMVGGPMPRQYVDSMVGFIESYDSSDSR